jgi:hypothetical protein
MTFVANMPGTCCDCGTPFAVGDVVAYVEEGTDDIGDVLGVACGCGDSGDTMELDGALSDGTPLRDVTMGMPLEVREMGDIRYHRVIAIRPMMYSGVFPVVKVERLDGTEAMYGTHYTRRPREARG